MDSLLKAEKLKIELDNLSQIDAEVEKQIMQNLRLDWNYQSNNSRVKFK